MASPSRYISALTLLVALLPLAACGSDPETDATEVGDVVSARGGVDTEGAPKAHLMLPTGRLDIRAGDPVDELTADATRERIARKAPEGGVFVPITWSYRTVEMEELEPIFGSALPIETTLVSDGERYRLAAPVAERDGERADAFYVAVDGTGEKGTIEVEYAGVTQTLDLDSGKRETGQAKGLYTLDTSQYSEKLKPCPTQDWVDEGPLVQAAFTCSRTDPLALLFVDGKWAPEGSTFVAIGVTSTLASFAAYAASGAGATYTVVSSKERTTLAGETPTRVLDEKMSTGFAAGVLVFTVKGKLPDNFAFHRIYQLVRSAVVGEIDAPYERKLDVRGDIPLR